MTVLANLSQEYQIDWLSDEIESYLSTVKLTDIDLILEYLQISKKMEFKNEVENNLVNQISDYFPKIQSSSLFTLLERRIQIDIAKKRLGSLMLSNRVNEKTTDLLACLRHFLSKPKNHIP